MLYKDYPQVARMEKKTKIIVLHMKELIYTGIFVFLGIVLILLLVFMFMPDADEEGDKEPAMSEYVAGVYSTSVMLNGSTFDVEVVVDESRINSIQLKNISETVTTMYPLLEPSLENISQQIYVNQSTENVTYAEDSKYTSMILINAIDASLEKAKASK